MMSISGEPGGAPVKCGVPVADLTTALYGGALDHLWALYERQRSGLGQLPRSQPSSRARSRSASGRRLLYFATGEVAGAARLGAPCLAAPYQAFACAGRAHHRGRQHPAPVGAAVRGDRPRGAARRPALRHQRRPHGATARSSSPSWRRRSPGDGTGRVGGARWSEAGVAAGPIHDYAEVFADPHTQAREMEVDDGAPRGGHRARARDPGEALRHARLGAPRGAAARRAHRGGPARGRPHARGDRRRCERPHRAPRAGGCGSRSTAPRRTTR